MVDEFDNEKKAFKATVRTPKGELEKVEVLECEGLVEVAKVRRYFKALLFAAAILISIPGVNLFLTINGNSAADAAIIAARKEMSEVYATRTELSALKELRATQIDNLSKKIDELRDDIKQLRADLKGK